MILWKVKENELKAFSAHGAWAGQCAQGAGVWSLCWPGGLCGQSSAPHTQNTGDRLHNAGGCLYDTRCLISERNDQVVT